MAFWNDRTLRVKRQHKFLVEAGPTAATNLFKFFAMEASRPSYQIGEHVHGFLDHKFKFPGAITWQDVTLKVADVKTGNSSTEDTSFALYHMLNNAGWRTPDNVPGANLPLTINKEAAVGALGKLVIKQIQGGNLDESNLGDDMTVTPGVTVLDTWSLQNAWIKQVNFGTLSYTSEAVTTIDLTISYDYAIFSPGSESLTAYNVGS